MSVLQIRNLFQARFIFVTLILISSGIGIATPLCAAEEQPSDNAKRIPYSNLDLHTLLDTLDRYIVLEKAYEDNARHNIALNKSKLATSTPATRLTLYESIGNEYLHLDIDSSMYYLKEGQAYADSIGNTAFSQRLHLISLQAIALKGATHLAVQSFEEIDPSTINEQDKVLYFECGKQIYHFALNSFSPQPMTEHFYERMGGLIDSLFQHTSFNPIAQQFFQAWTYVKSNEPQVREKAVPVLEKLLADLDMSNPRFALAASLLANYYEKLPNEDETIRYLTLSAISDIIAGNNETTSLHRLALIMHGRKDYERAFQYMTLSLQKSVDSGARIRALQIAEALPLVIETTHEHEEANSRLMYFVVLILATFAITLTLLFFRARHTRHQLTELQVRLAQRHDHKDAYIRDLLSLCAGYLNMFENYNRTTARKIKAGQINDLLDTINSGKIFAEQHEMFNKVFDEAFLNVYPDFVEQVNRLFEPDKQIRCPEDTKLTPELRLLAFMQLGLDDSSEIAKFLGISVNSVYTYRNKLKSRAIDRDNFETNIRKVSRLL